MSVHCQEWPDCRGRPLSDRRRCLRLRRGNWEDARYDQREQRNETKNRSLNGERLPIGCSKTCCKVLKRWSFITKSAPTKSIKISVVYWNFRKKSVSVCRATL